jgi:NitT/TauT family transport system substrate-binding protein
MTHVRLGSWALAVWLLAACSAAPSPVAVRVGIIGSIDELPMFVIEERGLDRRHNLRLEATSYVGGIRIIEAMAAGAVDVGWSIGTVPLLDAAQRGIVAEQLVAIATNTLADPDRPGMGVVVAPAVNGWRDLAGKVIGVYVVNSLGGAALRVRLQRENVRDARLVEIALPNLGLALAGGTVEAVTMPEPFVTQSILRGDGRLLGWVIGGSPLERMVYTVIVARSRFLREQPETVRALLRAHLDAVEWIDGHEQEARSIVARRLGISEELGRRIGLLRWPRDARNDVSLFLAMQDVLVQGGLLKTPIAAERVFDLGALNSVLRERGR